MRADAELIRLEEAAREATARGSKSFYFATRFFPPRMARAAHAVYWFCRTTDDIVDEALDPRRAARDLASWEDQLKLVLTGAPVDHPVLRLFGATVAEFGIPHEYPRELIEGVRMDLSVSRYASFEDLRVFCYRVASVVGLMMMSVIGYRGDPSAQAADLGIAMQLTNILRDVGEDLRRGRIYLPLEELSGFGYSEREMLAGARNDAFRRLMAFQCERARRYYASAAPGIPMLAAEGRFSVEVASKVYAGILDRIEASGYDVFDRRAVVPASKKYWITLRSMALPVMRQTLQSAVARGR